MKVFRKRHPDTSKRRERVIERLETQLLKGFKTKNLTGPKLELTQKDIERIKREIEILKTRL